MALIQSKQLNTRLTGSFTVSGSITGDSNSTATFASYGGNISGSSDSTGSFGSLVVDGNTEVGGDLSVTQYIKHKGDADTFINFTDNRIRFKAGDIGFLDLEKDGATPYPATINPGGNRINFRVVDRNTDLLLKTDSEALNVGLYHAGNRKLATKSDGVDVTGSLDIIGHVTASGNISGSSTSTGSFGQVTTTTPGRIISNITEIIEVTVVDDGGNHYAFEGATTPNLVVSEGKTYRFDQSDSTNDSHPFAFSLTEDGSTYTTGVTTVGTPGTTGAYTEIKVTKATANRLFYKCTSHSGMGNQGNILKNDLGNFGGNISGSSTSTGSFRRLNIDGVILDDGDISGSSTSTGSFGRVEVTANTIAVGGQPINATLVQNLNNTFSSEEVEAVGSTSLSGSVSGAIDATAFQYNGTTWNSTSAVNELTGSTWTLKATAGAGTLFNFVDTDDNSVLRGRKDKVLVFGRVTGSTPTAIAGGLMYSGSTSDEWYLGYENSPS